MVRTEEEILEEFTQKRIKELQGSATLKEITEEALLCRKTKTETLIVHFYNKDFKRCKEMNRVLEEIAPKYPSIQFLCAEAEKFPFITQKLEIQELPYLATFTEGYFTGGIIGFQDIGEEKLDVKLLEGYIRQSSLLQKIPVENNQ